MKSGPEFKSNLGKGKTLGAIATKKPGKRLPGMGKPTVGKKHEIKTGKGK